MGDRVLVQLKRKEQNGTEYSPVLYAHWSGRSVAYWIAALKERMAGRPDDLSYSFARLVQIALEGDDGNLSFGVWNNTEEHNDSHGDAGIVIVDIHDWSVTCSGGYLVEQDFLEKHSTV
jgi:hypothetical protein